jgi:hypothetical protein
MVGSPVIDLSLACSDHVTYISEEMGSHRHSIKVVPLNREAEVYLVLNSGCILTSVLCIGPQPLRDTTDARLSSVR